MFLLMAWSPSQDHSTPSKLLVTSLGPEAGISAVSEFIGLFSSMLLGKFSDDLVWCAVELLCVY